MAGVPKIVVFLASVLVVTGLGVTSAKMHSGGCAPDQYLMVGEEGSVRCCFTDGFYGVFWYNANNSREALIKITETGGKSGRGYEAGQYDIEKSDGSLVIKSVSVSHEGNYTVKKLRSTTAGDREEYMISLKTKVEASPQHLIIQQCHDDDPICFAGVPNPFVLSCRVENSRPPVSLRWAKRTETGDENVTSAPSVAPKDNGVFTSFVSTNMVLGKDSRLSLMVCKADDPLDLLEEDETVVFLSKLEDNLEDVATNSMKTYVEASSELELPCDSNNTYLQLWERIDRAEVHPTKSVILFSLNITEAVTIEKIEGFRTNERGGLLHDSITMDDDGYYVCTVDNLHTSLVTIYDVVVYVTPSPDRLDIGGCSPLSYCTLQFRGQGDLTCSLDRVRPKVELEWVVIDEDADIDVQSIHTRESEVEGTYSIILKSNVKAGFSTEKRVAVECRVVGEHAELFPLSTRLDILFLEIPISTTAVPVEEDQSAPLWIIAIVLPLVAIMAIIVFLLMRRRRQNQATARKGEEDMPLVTSKDEQMKKDFISQIKQKYKLLCEAVKPIPYIRERMFCVDNIFVEVGIDSEGSDSTFVSDDLNDSFSHYRIISKKNPIAAMRRLIEAEPGYGKTTLCLQSVYDWCTSNRASPIDDYEILIYLRLRQLVGSTTICEAIKEYILPRESKFTPEEIMDILQGSSSVLIIFDGYDEYPEKKDLTTDVNATFRSDMFPRVDVLLTSRLNCVPSDIITREMERICLSGFNEKARDQYLSKAVVGDDKVRAIVVKRQLEDNPILDDLCQVPLFFVLFAHMTHDNEEFHQLRSVTRLFRYIATCLHSHTKNKYVETVEEMERLEGDHGELDRLAFEGLAPDRQNLIWDRKKITEILGVDFIGHYTKVGILVEEDMFYDVEYKREIRFYHKLFAEWYAAYHMSLLVENASDPSEYTGELDKFDPVELQYLFRFACGISKVAAPKIIDYLKDRAGCYDYAMLCSLENEGGEENLMELVRDFVSLKVVIADRDSRLFQRSCVQLLEIASDKKLDISILNLQGSFDKVEESDGTLTLKTGLHLSLLPSLRELEISSSKREFNEEEILALLQYAARCDQLKAIAFIHCIIPMRISIEYLPMKLRNIRVSWWPQEECFVLNFNTNTWKCEYDNILMTTEVYEREAARVRRIKDPKPDSRR